jgi:hypothetical protein
VRSEMESSAAVCIRSHVYLRSPFQHSGWDGKARVAGGRARGRGWCRHQQEGTRSVSGVRADAQDGTFRCRTSMPC